MEENENILEIFSSVQGEGKYIGMRQVFVRFADCNIKCHFCDTEFLPMDFCQIETIPGAGVYENIPNPLSAKDVANKIRSFIAFAQHHSISLTGGEPLLHAPFIRKLAANIDLPLFLETNGTLCEAMESLLDVISYVSMDIKLPNLTGRNLWEEHRRFLLLLRHHDAYVKIVIAENTKEEEFQEAVQLIANVAPQMLLILQPVTPFGGLDAPSPQKLLSLQAQAANVLTQVRIIPQAHRMMGLC